MAALAVSPQTVTVGATAQLALTGTGTAWTPGTPGVPAFTVNRGVIASQRVTGPTTAVLTYTAPGPAGPVTFTDPSAVPASTAVVNVVARKYRWYPGLTGRR